MIVKRRKLKIRTTAIIPLFCGCLIKNGNRYKAYKIFLQVLRELRFKLNLNPFFIIESVIRRTRPVVYYKLKRKGKRIQQIPSLIRLRKSNILAIKWLINSAYDRVEKKFVQKLIVEILLLYSNIGVSYKKKREIYNIVLTNRAFLSRKQKK